MIIIPWVLFLVSSVLWIRDQFEIKRIRKINKMLSDSRTSSFSDLVEQIAEMKTELEKAKRELEADPFHRNALGGMRDGS